MDDVDRLIAAFESRGQHDHAAWKLDILMDLGQRDDPRVVALYARVLADDREPTEVRIDALRRLRESSIVLAERGVVVTACLRALRRDQQRTLRLQAALALGDFVTTDAALQALSSLAAAPAETIELRYNAFTALQRAGPTEACLARLRALEADDVLGPSVRSLLASWDRA